jgi:hypothetical protein
MSEIELINPYYSNAPLKNFSDLDEKLKYYYDYIGDYDAIPKGNLTPRAIKGDFRSTSRDIYYYISWLYDNNPKLVLDFFCGHSHWKKFFPNIYSVDIAEWNYSSIDCIIHENEINNFIETHNQYFDCGMAINGIHFGTFDQVKENITKCMSMIKSNGRFLFTLNMKVILSNNTGPNRFHSRSRVEVDTYYFLHFYEMLKQTEYKIILFDMCATKVQRPEINGDIRFILEKE